MRNCLKRNRLLLAVTVILSAVSSVAGVFVALFLQEIVDITLKGDLQGFFQVLWAILIYLAAFALIYGLYSLCSKLLVRNVTRLLRKQVFQGIFRRSYPDFSSTNTADYLSALTNDVKLIEENYILPMLLTLQYAVTFLATLVVLLVLSPLVTVCLIGCMLLMFLVPSLLGKALQGRQQRLSDQLSAFTVRLKDFFSGFEVIKAYRITGNITEEFHEENQKLAQTKYAADKMFVLNEGLSQLLATLTQVASIFLAAFLVIRGQITMGTLIAIVQLGGSFVMPVVMMMQNFPKVKSIKPVLKRMDELADYQDTSFTGTKPPTFSKAVELRNVSFSYQPGQPVLREADLCLRKNHKYAVVGGSGCGKTTLIKLLTGYYPQFEGEILYDGVNLRELDMERLRAMVSMIHQNVYMFDKDVQDNICLYQQHQPADLEQALADSGVQGFLDQLPGGLHAPVGENGANLSGGQRQRIAIARALLQKTPILVLDEGTSAIDMQTAYDIESRLLKIKDLTLITITHKMSPELLGGYDQILYMENGRVAEQGTLSELLEQKQGFARFFTLQDD